MPQILDQHGQPFDVALLDEPQTAKVGYLHREFENHPSRGLTPQRLHRILVEAEQGSLLDQLDLACDMLERDAHLFAEVSKRRGAVTGPAYSVEPPEGANAAEKKITDQVRYWLGSLQVVADGCTGGLPLAIGAMTDAIVKGFASIEMVWTLQSDGSSQVRLPQLTAQPQRWFVPSADRRRLLLRSQTEFTQATGPGSDYLPPVQGVELLPYAWIMHTHSALSGYVTRMSLARVLAWPYLFKNFAVRDLAEFLEIYGLPIRIGKYAAGASSDEKLTLLRAVTQIGHNAAGIIPQGMSIEFQKAAEGHDQPFLGMVEYMDKALSKAILGQTLTADAGNKGSHALGKVHNEVRMDIRADDAARIEATLTQQLVHPLVLLNIPGADPRRMPRVQLDLGEAEDLAAFAESLPPLVALGIQVPVSWVQAKLRIPDPLNGEAVLKPAPAGTPANIASADTASLAAMLALLGGNATGHQCAPLAGQAGPAPRDAVDDIVAQATAQWRPQLAPLVAPLLAELAKAVAAGESTASFAARLPGLVALMDSAPLAASLGRAAFDAHLIGAAGLPLAPAA